MTAQIIPFPDKRKADREMLRIERLALELEVLSPNWRKSPGGAA